MNVVVPVEITTADGVTRQLRATYGARKRIHKRFDGISIQEAIEKFGDEAAVEIVYLMMYDEHGKQPSISLEEFHESLDFQSVETFYALIISALTQGKKSPNEIMALVETLNQSQSLTTSTGSTPGDSADSASDSQTESSGTATSNVKSTLLEMHTESKSEPAHCSPPEPTTRQKRSNKTTE